MSLVAMLEERQLTVKHDDLNEIQRENFVYMYIKTWRLRILKEL